MAGKFVIESEIPHSYERLVYVVRDDRRVVRYVGSTKHLITRLRGHIASSEGFGSFVYGEFLEGRNLFVAIEFVGDKLSAYQAERDLIGKYCIEFKSDLLNRNGAMRHFDFSCLDSVPLHEISPRFKRIDSMRREEKIRKAKAFIEAKRK